MHHHRGTGRRAGAGAANVSAVAAVDCGTNSLRLLIAEPGPDGRLHDLRRELRMVRLGQDVDATGVFAPEALRRTFAACDEYAALIAEHDVTAIRCCATAAARDVANRDAFVRGMRDHLGVAPDVISGEEEAELSFRGATAGVGTLGLPGPYLVVDIGGGSTEFVLGQQRMETVQSVPMGSVRMTERHLHSDPPSAAEIAAAAADVDELLDRLEVRLADAATLVGVAGTVTTVAAMALRLTDYDPDRIHHARIPLAAVAESTARLLAMTRAERAALGFMHPGRADVIGAGSLVLDRICRRVADSLAVPEVLVSEHDILDGIAAGLL